MLTWDSECHCISLPFCSVSLSLSVPVLKIPAVIHITNTKSIVFLFSQGVFDG